MAYNPSIYQPYGQQQSWMYQPTQTQPVNGLVSVTGIEGAKAYQLPPNSAMPLFDSNDDVLYLKTTDGAGFPTVKAFSFSPIEQPQPQADYATRDELAKFEEKLDEVMAKLDALPKPRTRKAATDGE